MRERQGKQQQVPPAKESPGSERPLAARHPEGARPRSGSPAGARQGAGRPAGDRADAARKKQKTRKPKPPKPWEQGPGSKARREQRVEAEAKKTPGVLKTLDRVLSKAGLVSRSEARSWIGAGRVAVNGQKIGTPDFWLDSNDHVTVDGKPLVAARKRYLVLYKPKGYLTTSKDPEGRPTIYDLLSGLEDKVFPVGRLDQNTTGLLLLTNDTDFGARIASPEFKVPKTYLVKASTLLTDEQLDRLAAGIELADGPTRPAIVGRIRDSVKYTFFEITITEGRNRQVRRMVEALGSVVLKLVRTRIGPLEIGTLEIGKCRDLTSAEVAALREGHA